MLERTSGSIEGVGRPGFLTPGPPWILGWRGVPLEAPENTLAGFGRALAAGLDGIHYDLRAADGGDPVVLADETLERTTDGSGRVADRTLTELFQLDAGSWFSRSFVGEPVPHLDEVLDLGEEPSAQPMHWVELHQRSLVREVAKRVQARRPGLSLRVASPNRELCLEIRDAGLPAGLIAAEANEDDLRFVRDERLEAYAVTLPGGWCTEAAALSWPCERWSLGLAAPRDLLRACRLPLNAFTTSEARRALAVRSLVRLSPDDGGDYPLEVPLLPVSSYGDEEGGGEWCGRWEHLARVRNPFPFEVNVLVQVFVRLGAFEVEGLPVRSSLAVGETMEVPYRLSGGSWSPGGDPLLAVLFDWREGPGRPAGRLLLDAPLERVRSVVADAVTQRLELLRESPGQPRASMTVRRRGRELVVAIENPGGLGEARTVVHLGGHTWYGGGSIRARLPEGFDTLRGGLPFSCALLGREGSGPGGRTVLRRWAGGLPEGPASGAPGLLFPRPSG